MAKKRGGKREGAGRRRSVGGRVSKGMGLLLGDDLQRDLDLAAGELGITRGELLRRLARRALTDKAQIVIIRSDLRKEREAKGGNEDA